LRSSPLFSCLWLGALISGLGDGLTWIALQWLMLERTNDSGTAVGLMLCFGLPAMLTGTPMGASGVGRSCRSARHGLGSLDVGGSVV
jgi:hypothetical protein